MKQAKCKSSTVRAETVKIKNIDHAATVSHPCVLLENHAEKFCQCECDLQWLKFNTIK